MKVPSCSNVLWRNTGAVSRMKSFQNCPGSSGSAGGGPSRISRSSNPFASSVPANDSSTTNTTRWPRERRTSPIPTQLLVGPNAPSGKKTIVLTRSPHLALAREDRIRRKLHRAPHRLAVAIRTGSPARSELRDDRQSPPAFVVGSRAQLPRHRARRIVNLDRELVASPAQPDPDRRPSVDEGIGDELADDQRRIRHHASRHRP